MPPLNDGGPGALFTNGGTWIAACATPCASGDYWACVDKVSWPPPNPGLTTIDFYAWNYPSQTSPIAGLSVQVCRNTDTHCDTPLADGGTGPNGMASLSFENIDTATGLGVNGYLQITSSEGSTMLYLYTWGYPLSEKVWPHAYYAFESPSSFQAQAAALGVTPDLDAGHLFVYALDCLGSPAPGVNVSVNVDAGLEFNFVGLANAATESSGIVGIYNLPPGVTEVTATPLVLGKPSSKVEVNIRAGYITAVLLYPTPMP